MWILIPLLLLRGAGGVFKAAAFAAGATTVRVLQGILFGRVCRTATAAMGGKEADLIASTLLLVLGVFLLITIVKTWGKGDDPDAPPPRWITMLGSVSALTAFGIGALLIATGMKQWIFTLSAIAVINEAQLGQELSILTYIFYIIAAQSLMLTPIIGSALAPVPSAKILERVRGWLERNNRVIRIVISLIFGVWFLSKGTTGLLAHGHRMGIVNHLTVKADNNQ